MSNQKPVSRTEVADVLERAADLYESEQIDWCKGSWGSTYVNQVEGQFHCAEGAILRAAGFTMSQIINSRMLSENSPLDGLMETPVVKGATKAVNEHLGLVHDRLYYYNDILPSYSAKETLIQTFKETAKELRNGS